MGELVDRASEKIGRILDMYSLRLPDEEIHGTPNTYLCTSAAMSAAMGWVPTLKAGGINLSPETIEFYNKISGSCLKQGVDAARMTTQEEVDNACLLLEIILKELETLKSDRL